MWWPSPTPTPVPPATPPAPAAVRPEDYVTPKVGGTNDPAFDALAELSDRISPLAACRVMFVHTPYNDTHSAVTPAPLRDDLFDPCAGIAHVPTDWTSPKGRDYSICGRCGTLLDVA